MSKIKTLFPSLSSLEKNANTVNQAGAPAFHLPLQEKVMNCLMLGTFEPTFYTSAQDLIESTLATLLECREKDPNFLAKAVVYGSEKGCIEDAPILGLLVLSAGNSTCKKLTRQIFRRVIRTPKQLAKFLTMCRSGKVRGMGRLIKTLTSDFLNNLSPIHVIKYGSSGREWTLFDMFQVSHTKCMNVKTLNIREYLKTGSTSQLGSEWGQVLGYKEFLDSKDVGLISKYNLPYEVVTSQISSDEAWSELLKGERIAYQWLLKNLNNLQKHDCLKNEEALDRVCGILKDQRAILASKQMPYKLYTAIRNLKDAPKKVTNALYSAIESTLGNIGNINGNTLVAVDVSASMTSQVSSKSVMSVSDIASLFGASLYKSSDDVDIVLFSTYVHNLKASSVSTVVDLAEAIRRESNGSGTDFSCVIKHIMNSETKYDNVIFITDGEDWVNSSRNSANDLINKYRNEKKKDLKVLQILVAPYGTTRINPKNKNTFTISGWSDSVFKVVPQLLNGASGMIQEVEKITLDKSE